MCPQVTDINAMFSDAKYFDQDLSKWNMDKVTDMDFIFRQASAFNRGMFMWNVDKVMYMRNKLCPVDPDRSIRTCPNGRRCKSPTWRVCSGNDIFESGTV